MSVNVTSSITGIVRHVTGHRCADDIDRELELPNLKIMVGAITEKLQTVWHVISLYVTDFEVLAESLLEQKEEDLVELGNAISILLSLIYFHMEAYEEACSWALHSGNYVYNLLTNSNLATLGSCGDAYRQLLSIKLIDKYVNEPLGDSEMKTIASFMTSMVDTTIEHAVTENEQVAAITLILGLAHRTATIEWLEKLIMTFPKHLIHLLRLCIRLPKESIPYGAEPEHKSVVRDKFRKESIRRMIQAVVVGCEIEQTVLVYRRDHQDVLLCDRDYSAIQGKCRKIVMPTPEERRELSLVRESTDPDFEESWDRHYNMISRSVAIMQPFFDIFDGLVALNDDERLFHMIMMLYSGKYKIQNQMSLPETKQVVLQMCLDLASYYPYLAKKVRDHMLSPDTTNASASTSSFKRVIYCISGRVRMHLRLEVMSRKNMVDMKLLEQLRVTCDGRESLTHLGLMLCHGLSTAFVTSDAFLRNNVDWYKKAICWSKFAGASTLGVTHRGHVENSKSSGKPRSLTILKNYLPVTKNVHDDGSDFEGNGLGASYSEGGGLFALGLIHAGAMYPLAKRISIYHLKNIPLPDDFGEIKSVPVHHGAALALGLVCLGEHDSDAQEAFFEALNKDNSVIGEGCAYGMGLNGASSGNMELAEGMLDFARETLHEKIKRSLATSVSMLFIEKEAGAEAMINNLLADYNPWIRIGGVWTIATAYAGTCDPQKIDQLFKLTIFDTHDHIRRTAAIALGFVCCNNTTVLMDNASLLLENYQPHLRYGSAIAIGVGCAGTGLNRAISLLNPLTEDPVPFVRHAAHLALGLVISNVPEKSVSHSKIEAVKKDIFKVARAKSEEGLVRFGALLGVGFACAGGGNAQIGLMAVVPRGAAKNLHVLDHHAVCGLVLFCNYWYWYPLVNMVIISMRSQLHSVLNHRLQCPSDHVLYDSTPAGTFGYPAPAAEVVSKKKRKVRSNPTHNRKMISRRNPALKVMPPSTPTDKANEDIIDKGDKVETDKPEPVDAKEECTEPKTDETKGHYFELPARISEIRSTCISSGGANLIKSPPEKNDSPTEKKVSTLVCGLKREDGNKYSRYVPIMNSRYLGNVIVIDRFSEVGRMPVITNISAAFEPKIKKEAKKKESKTAPIEPTPDEAADEAAEGTIEATGTLNIDDEQTNDETNGVKAKGTDDVLGATSKDDTEEDLEVAKDTEEDLEVAKDTEEEEPGQEEADKDENK